LASDGFPALRAVRPVGQDQMLDYSARGLTELPPEVSQHADLQELNLARNQLTALPPEIGQLTGLQRLWLDGNQLTALPPEIGQLTGLRELSLGRNQLSGLPREIGQLTGLEELIISGNQLSGLPREIGQLTRLRTLWLDGNRLSELPPEIPRLASLRTLGLDGNQLSGLPPEIGQLTRLRTLGLGGNQLSGLPPEIGQLTRLRTLGLGGNQLSGLPPEIGQLTHLETLWLGGNQLTALPYQLADLLTDDLELEWAGNPLKEPFPELFERGYQALATYLRSLAGAIPQYEAKVLLVGEGNVGKTSLLAALRGAPFVEGRPTTHGIEVQVLTMRHPHLDVDMIMRLWDFGGQEVYRITHQFFFSRRALYLVVWNAREGQEKNEVKEWLCRIQLRVSQGARALVVATHCDERQPELDYPSLKQSVPGLLVGRYEVDNRSGHGISGLQEGIAAEVSQLPKMGQFISPRWIAARDEILACAQSEPLMPYARFAEISQRHDVHDDEIIIFAELMHDLGQIVYYGDDEGLQDFVVLNPEWLTKAISYVIEDDSTKQSGGILDHARLPTIWQNLQDGLVYSAHYYPYFLRLMEKFDVSYRLDDGNRSLVAQLVPHERPDLPWDIGTPLSDGFRSLALVYQLSGPVPGLIAWLTVRNHRFSTEKHWRRGVFLCHPVERYASEALIELHDSNRLAVDVRAPSPDHFFNVLWDNIEDLLRRRWPGLEYTPFVPCPTRNAEGLRCPGRFPLRFLLGYREQGRTLTPCQECLTDWDISELLTGFAQPALPLQPQLQLLHDKLAGVTGGVTRLEERMRQLQSVAAESADSMRRILKVVSSEITDCPRLFTLTPESLTFGQRLRFYQENYRLVLWCEHPDHWHSWPAASYSLKMPKGWLVTIAPYATLVVKALQLVAPIAASAVGVAMSDKHSEDVKNQLELMKTLIAALPSQKIEDQAEFVDPNSAGWLTSAAGEAARGLREVLFAHDRMKAFGGLRHVVSPSGDTLWVCAHHYPVYDPGLPSIPGHEP
jgi:internalin A